MNCAESADWWRSRALLWRRQLIQDDKGTVAILAFGLPYLTHEDDPLRGVMCGLLIREQLQHLVRAHVRLRMFQRRARALYLQNMRCSIGITTGDAYCGSVGNEFRCEYAIVGDCVNLRCAPVSIWGST